MTLKELKARMAEAKRCESNSTFATVSHWRDEYRAIAEIALHELAARERADAASVPEKDFGNIEGYPV